MALNQRAVDLAQRLNIPYVSAVELLVKMQPPPDEDGFCPRCYYAPGPFTGVECPTCGHPAQLT